MPVYVFNNFWILLSCLSGMDWPTQALVPLFASMQLAHPTPLLDVVGCFQECDKWCQAALKAFVARCQA